MYYAPFKKNTFSYYCLHHWMQKKQAEKLKLPKIPAHLNERRIYNNKNKFVPYSTLIPLEKYKTEKDKIEAYAENIKLHAMMRTILFFYLLIAYNNTRCYVTTAKTNLQHGVGNHAAKIDAAHCTFFPRLIDFPIPKKGVRTEILHRKKSIIDGTFFYHFMNITFLIPTIVNREIDPYFEGGAVPSNIKKRLLMIVNLISLCHHNPKHGLHLYFKLMNMAFKKRHKFIEAQPKNQRKIMATVFNYQRQGTFFIANKHLRLKKKYQHFLLNQPKSESDDAAFRRIQKEILRR